MKSGELVWNVTKIQNGLNIQTDGTEMVYEHAMESIWSICIELFGGGTEICKCSKNHACLIRLNIQTKLYCVNDTKL